MSRVCNRAALLLGGCLLGGVLLGGCGAAKVPETVDENTIVVTKEGAVTSYLVGILDKDYYDVSGLAGMAVSEAAAYNEEQGSGKDVIIDSVNLLEDESGKVVITYRFANAETYEAFTRGVLFCGTPGMAQVSGYDLDSVSFLSAKSGAPASREELAGLQENTVIVTDGRAQIYAPSKVLYYSEGSSLMDNGAVDASQAQELVYIIIK